MRRISRLTFLRTVALGVAATRFAQTRVRRAEAAVGALAFAPTAPLPPPANQASNQAGEPQLRVDPRGYLFAVASNGPAGRTDVWRSTDRGRSFTYVPVRITTPGGGTGAVPPAAGDADVAVAPILNQQGYHNLYVAALSRDAVLLFTSKDGGQSWTTNSQAATGFGEDREWVAALGDTTIFMSYRDGTTGQFYVLRSDDAGGYFRQIAPVINVRDHPELGRVGNGNSVSGNLVVDHNGASPGFGNVYSPFLAAESSAPVAAPSAWSGPQQASQRPNMNMIWMSVSTDGGANFKNYLVYRAGPDQQLSHIFISCAADLGGNVYIVWSDARDVWLAVSTDQGVTWGQPIKVSRPPSSVAVVPWICAGGSGRIGVAWYGAQGTDLRQQENEWYVYYATSTNATSREPVFQQARASSLIYRGFVCEEGFACGQYGRNLFEDFGLALDPSTGLVTIVYTDSQPTNTMQSIHSRYMTQSDGPRLIGP